MDNTRFPAHVFKELYRLRWGIETCFDRLKNKLLTSCFVGHKADAIYQEVYANVLIHNLHQLLVTPAQIIVNQKVKTKKAEDSTINTNKKSMKMSPSEY